MNAATWFVLALLLAINALFVAAEFAAVSVRRGRVRRRAEGGSKAARRLLPVLNDHHLLDRYIAACQIGITLSSLGLGAYGQARFGSELAPLFGRFGDMSAVAAVSASAAAVLIGLTVLQMVLGELVPKSLALQMPTRTALFTATPMGLAVTLLRPFIWILNGSGTLLLRLFGAEASGERHVHSPEEIDMLIADSRAGGLLEREEEERLQRGLQLGGTSVAELMIPRDEIVAVSIDAPWTELRETAERSPYTRLPVYRGGLDEMVGVVHTRDVARAAAGEGPFADAGALMRPLLSVPAATTAERLLALFQEHDVQIAVVTDDAEGTAGVVTLDDVVAELVGELGDEFKPAPQGAGAAPQPAGERGDG
jgi:CBS domain containing-hemolysin-like protein